MPPVVPALASIAAVLSRSAKLRAYRPLDAAAIRLAMNPQTYAVHEQGRASVKPAELRR